MASCSVSKTTVRETCSGYWYTNQEYNLSQINIPWHPPRENYIYANDTLLMIIDYYRESNHYVSNVFVVETTISGQGCNYRSDGTMFLLKKNRSSIIVNHLGELNFQKPYWAYMGLRELNLEEANELLNDTN